MKVRDLRESKKSDQESIVDRIVKSANSNQYPGVMTADDQGDGDIILCVRDPNGRYAFLQVLVQVKILDMPGIPSFMLLNDWRMQLYNEIAADLDRWRRLGTDMVKVGEDEHEGVLWFLGGKNPVPFMIDIPDQEF